METSPAARRRHDDGGSFCICNGLLSSAGYNPDVEEPLYTTGANGYRIDRIMTVRELMDELSGQPVVTSFDGLFPRTEYPAP